jgi:hypothetical protein
MALFLFATANPSGFEIASMFLLVVELLLFIDYRHSQLPIHKRYLPLITTSLLASSARPSTFFWVSFVIVFFVWLYRAKLDPQKFTKILLCTLPGVSFGALYFLLHRAIYQLPNYIPDESKSSTSVFFSTFIDSIGSTFERLTQAYGQLGWLDTVPPTILLVSLLIIWSSWLRENIFSNKLLRNYFFVCFGLLIIIIATIEYSVARSWPHFWQGRYQLPVFMAFILVFSSLAGEKIKHRMTLITLVSTFGSMYMVALNYFRYSTGVSRGFPITFKGIEGASLDIYLLSTTFILIFLICRYGIRNKKF